MPITKEHAEFTFRDYLGETVLDRLWNYFGETDRDILKEDFEEILEEVLSVVVIIHKLYFNSVARSSTPTQRAPIALPQP